MQLQIIQHEELGSCRRAAAAVPRGFAGQTRRNHSTAAGCPWPASVDSYTIFADPSVIAEPGSTRRGALPRAGRLHASVAGGRLRRLGAAEKEFKYVERLVTVEQAGRVCRLGAEGIGFEVEPERVLSEHGARRARAGLSSGSTTTRSRASSSPTTRCSKGGRAWRLVQKDAQESHFNRRVETASVPGRIIELTRRSHPADHRRARAAAGVRENRAAGGWVVVLDPWTGEILAIASYPTFNPNAYGRRQDTRRNRATEDPTSQGRPSRS